LQAKKLLEVLDRFLEAMHRSMKARALVPIEKQLEKDMQRAFRAQGKLFLQKFEKRFKSLFAESVRLSESVPPEDINEILTGVFVLTSDLIREPIIKAAKKAMKSAALKTIADLKIDIAFDLENPRAVEYLELHGAERVTMINETTREQIKAILVKGTEEGWSYDKIAREISDRFEEFAIGKPQQHIQSRAHLVAVTETANAYEEGNRIAALEIQKHGIPMEKSWLTVGDDRVSDGCQENQDAGWIDIDEPFPSGHQRPPRFPSCRCDCLYRRKPERGE